ncbi:MAG: hypothetical protein NTX59_11950 [Elusimicrobia bacterium]|nr:hypothetical protein [Elusimicrobiota bacterium]
MDTQQLFTNVKPSKFSLAPRRAGYYDVSDIIMSAQFKVEDTDVKALEDIDLIYRALCAVLYNFVPASGHPGGSISSGRIAQALLFFGMDYDFFAPQRADNDLISYAAGHKAMGLYALWALRNELVRIADSSRLPEEKLQLRLEDLLGFRRNPSADTPLFKKFNSKALDGHPTPLTPFVKTATGASGAGVGAAVGLALGAMDVYGPGCPRVHMLEGEGGMTPGRVAESLASAATAQLSNLYMHVDWNQASIDSNNVCPENSKPGDYVQWTPAELAYLNDWNVVHVSNGHDFFQILTAQKFAADNSDNKQPTAIVYRTTKGWKYGIEGRASHGAGHKFASDGYYAALSEFENRFNVKIPRYCSNSRADDAVEACFCDTLLTVRKALENTPALPSFALRKLNESRARLDTRARTPRAGSPNHQAAFEADPQVVPAELRLEPGSVVTPGEALSRALNHLNLATSGSIIVSAADLYGSTGVNLAGKGFAEGFYNAVSNSKSRILSAGGICEDAMGSIMSGLSSFGCHIGVTSSYAAFIAPLEHTSARLHAIGQQMRRALDGRAYNPFIMINAHSGVKTGEDGPTHADPQPLQLLEGNFPKGAVITLTPWEPQEVWPLLAAALRLRPAVIAPFITRPPEKIINRIKAGLPPAQAAIKGIYPLLKASRKKPPCHGTIVLQGNGVTTVFVNEVLPEIRKMGLNLNVFYVASKELYELLDENEKESLYPEHCALEAMGITDFTLPTMYFWARSKEGIARTLHAFKQGRYPCSGKAEAVMKESGLDADAQLKAITDYARFRCSKAANDANIKANGTKL